MDEVVAGIIFLMILIQVMSMYDNMKRSDKIAAVLAVQMKGQNLLSKSIYDSIEEQRIYQEKDRMERIAQFRELMERTTHRVTRTELNAWTKGLQASFPMLKIPLMPQIDAPQDVPVWHPPLILHGQ